MPRNAAGTYTLPNPAVVTGTDILSVDENVTRDDMAAELTNSLDRQGRGGMVAPFRIADGTIASPGLAFLNDTDNGLFRSGVDTWHAVAGAQILMTFTPNTVTIPAGVTLNIGISPVPPTTGWYAESADVLRTPNNVVIDKTLTVTADAGGFAIKVRGRPGDGAGALQFFDNLGTTQQAYIYADNTNAIHFLTSAGFTSNQVTILHSVNADRQLTLTGSNGSAPVISTTAGNLFISAASDLVYLGSQSNPANAIGFSSAVGFNDIFAENAAADGTLRLFSKGAGGRHQFYTGGYGVGAGQVQITHIAGTNATVNLHGGVNPASFATVTSSAGNLALSAQDAAPSFFITPAGKMLVQTLDENITGSGTPVLLSFDGLNAVYCIATFNSTVGNISHQVFVNGNGIVGMIQTQGVNTIYATSSDYRLKKNVVPITDGVAQVLKMKPVGFDWTVGGSGHGFIAHELQQYFPTAVAGEKDAMYPNGTPKHQAVDTSMLVPWLCAAIQELHSRLSTLEP